MSGDLTVSNEPSTWDKTKSFLKGFCDNAAKACEHMEIFSHYTTPAWGSREMFDRYSWYGDYGWGGFYGCCGPYAPFYDVLACRPVMYQPMMYQPMMYQPVMYQPMMYQPMMRQPQPSIHDISLSDTQLDMIINPEKYSRTNGNNGGFTSGNNGGFTSGINSNTPMSDLSLDQLINPEKYRGIDTGAGVSTTGNSDSTKPKPEVPTIIGKDGKDARPNWYKTLAEKIARKEKLTAQEQEMYDNYYFMQEKYNPTADTGESRAFRDDIKKLHRLLQNNEEEAAIKMMKTLAQQDPKKLAALEFWWIEVNADSPDKSGKGLRYDLTKNLDYYSLGWIGGNSDEADEMLKLLDDNCAKVSPRNMALALCQSINDYGVICCGKMEIDRIKPLIESVKDNPAFLRALKEEYSKLTNKDL